MQDQIKKLLQDNNIQGNKVQLQQNVACSHDSFNTETTFTTYWATNIAQLSSHISTDIT